MVATTDLKKFGFAEEIVEQIGRVADALEKVATALDGISTNMPIS